MTFEKLRKQFNEMSKEELVSLFSTIIKDNLEATKFDMNLANKDYQKLDERKNKK